MSNLRRYFTDGNYYFITTVTRNRIPALVDNSDLCITAMKRTSERFNLEILAWVILLDHIHLIIDPRGENISDIMKIFKQYFGFLYRQRSGMQKGRVWQLRFWGHVIRDQKDLNCHIDYIHYNPVKHGLVHTAREYKYSSFPEFVKKGLYQEDCGEREKFNFNGEFGELYGFNNVKPPQPRPSLPQVGLTYSDFIPSETEFGSRPNLRKLHFIWE